MAEKGGCSRGRTEGKGYLGSRTDTAERLASKTQNRINFSVGRQGGIKCGNRGTGFLDSEDPKHTLFCRETAFVAIYALFKG